MASFGRRRARATASQLAPSGTNSTRSLGSRRVEGVAIVPDLRSPAAYPRRVPRRTRLCFETCGMTDPGLQRDANEDAFVLRPDLGLFVVADGISRSRAGALAAPLSV